MARKPKSKQNRQTKTRPHRAAPIELAEDCLIEIFLYLEPWQPYYQNLRLVCKEWKNTIAKCWSRVSWMVRTRTQTKTGFAKHIAMCKNLKRLSWKSDFSDLRSILEMKNVGGSITRLDFVGVNTTKLHLTINKKWMMKHLTKLKILGFYLCENYSYDVNQYWWDALEKLELFTEHESYLSRKPESDRIHMYGLLPAYGSDWGKDLEESKKKKYDALIKLEDDVRLDFVKDKLEVFHGYSLMEVMIINNDIHGLRFCLERNYPFHNDYLFEVRTTETAKFLVSEAGLNGGLKGINKYKRITPFLYTCSNISILQRTPEGIASVMLEAAKTEEEKNKMLYATDQFKNTAAHMALMKRPSSHFHTNLIEMLFGKYKFKLDAKNNKGEGYLHVLLRSVKHHNSTYDRVHLVEYLCKIGVDVTAQDKLGNLPLHLACQLPDSFPITKVLIKTGGPDTIKQKNNAGKTPLQILLEKPTCSLEEVEHFVVKCPEALETDEMDNNILHILFTKIKGCPEEILKKFPDLIKAKNKEGQTPLHVAALKGNFVLRLVEYIDNTIANLKDNMGRTILNCLACSREHYTEGIIKQLVKKGCNPDTQDNELNTPLLNALKGSVSFGYLSKVRAFLKYSTDKTLSLNNKDNISPVIMLMQAPAKNKAMRNGKLTLLREMCEKGASLTSCSTCNTDKEFKTTLHLACENGEHEIIAYILKTCNNPDFVNQATKTSKKTALHIVSENAELNSMKLLLDAGANPLLLDSMSRSSLTFAVASRNSACINLILENIKKDTNVQNEYSLGEYLRKIVKPIELDAILHEATKIVQVPAVVFDILDYRLQKLDQLSSDTEALKQHIRTEYTLLNSGPSATKFLYEDQDNRNILFNACEIGDVEIVKRVLKLYSKLKAVGFKKLTLAFVDKMGQNLLHILSASTRNELNLVEIGEMLLKTGQFVEVINQKRDEDNCTALHICAMKGKSRLCKLLIEYGAHPRVVNNTRKTPEDLALEAGHYSMSRIFSSTLLKKRKAENQQQKNSSKKLRRSLRRK